MHPRASGPIGTRDLRGGLEMSAVKGVGPHWSVLGVRRYGGASPGSGGRHILPVAGGETRAASGVRCWRGPLSALLAQCFPLLAHPLPAELAQSQGREAQDRRWPIHALSIPVLSLSSSQHGQREDPHQHCGHRPCGFGQVHYDRTSHLQMWGH